MSQGSVSCIVLGPEVCPCQRWSVVSAKCCWNFCHVWTQIWRFNHCLYQLVPLLPHLKIAVFQGWHGSECRFSPPDSPDCWMYTRHRGYVMFQCKGELTSAGRPVLCRGYVGFGVNSSAAQLSAHFKELWLFAVEYPWQKLWYWVLVLTSIVALISHRMFMNLRKREQGPS